MGSGSVVFFITGLCFIELHLNMRSMKQVLIEIIFRTDLARIASNQSINTSSLPPFFSSSLPSSLPSSISSLPFFDPGTIHFNSIQFNSIQSNPIQFNSIQSNSLHFNSLQFTSIQFNSIQFNPINSLQPNQFSHSHSHSSSPR